MRWEQFWPSSGRVSAAVVGIAILLLVVAATASASSGQITRAEANATWTQGSFSFTVTWTECVSTCDWLPVATVQPTLPSYSCQGDEALDSDPNTKVVWSGGGQSANGTVSADVDNVSILSGVQGQRVCLSVIDRRQIRDPVCVAQAPILGYDPNTCPFKTFIFGHVMHTRLMDLAPTGGGAPPPAAADSQACADARKQLAKAKKKLKAAKEKDKKAKIKKAKKKVKKAKQAVAEACA